MVEGVVVPVGSQVLINRQMIEGKVVGYIQSDSRLVTDLFILKHGKVMRVAVEQGVMWVVLPKLRGLHLQGWDG